METTTKPTIEDLLKPRYRVLLDYPGSDYSVGEIIYLTDGNGECDEFYSIDEDGKHVEWEKFYKDYPKIFAPLYWWEERKVDELPKYLNLNGVIYRADKWEFDFEIHPVRWNEAGKRDGRLAIDWHHYKAKSKPATEQEYLTCINS